MSGWSCSSRTRDVLPEFEVEAVGDVVETEVEEQQGEVDALELELDVDCLDGPDVATYTAPAATTRMTMIITTVTIREMALHSEERMSKNPVAHYLRIVRFHMASPCRVHFQRVSDKLYASRFSAASNASTVFVMSSSVCAVEITTLS